MGRTERNWPRHKTNFRFRGCEPLADSKSDLGRRELAERLYRKLDKTEEWAENNYYHLPIENQNAGLVTVNAFWRTTPRDGKQAAFLSTNLAEARGTSPR